MKSIPGQWNFVNQFNIDVHYLTCTVSRFHIDKNFLADVGFEPTLPQQTLRGQSFNELDYRAGAFKCATFNSLCKIISKSQYFGEDSVSAQTIKGICHSRMFHKKLWDTYHQHQ